MATETLVLGNSELRFSSGTVVAGIVGAGMLHQRRPDGRRLRSASMPAELDTGAELQAAFDAMGIREQETLIVEADLRTTPVASDIAVLAPAVPAGDTAPRVVLYVDESGGMSWHFAQQQQHSRLRSRRHAITPEFVIPLRQRAVRQTLSQGMPRRRLRGVITKIGRKLFKILVLPVASELLQDPLRWVAEKVDGHLRNPLLWQPTPDNFRQVPDPARPFTDWDSLKDGPVLLIVHGIFSSVQGMLARLPREAMEDWHARYGGRVIAYNHPTVTASAEDNAQALLQQLKDGLGGNVAVVDILCHSRGGIVSRALAEQGDLLVRDHGVTVRSIYFVATPNAGSPLGDAEHMVDMIDTFTNVIGHLDDGPVAYSLEAVVGLVMLVGHAVVKALPGISSLGTEGSYVSEVLNGAKARTSRSLYAAAASNFEPQPGRENGWLIDRLGDPVMDRIFTKAGVRAPNDLIVPQQGVFAANGHPKFPIANPLVYEAADGVWHSAFFAQGRTLAHLATHMTRVAHFAMIDKVFETYLDVPPGATPDLSDIDLLTADIVGSKEGAGGTTGTRSRRLRGKRGLPSAADAVPSTRSPRSYVPQGPLQGDSAMDAMDAMATQRDPRILFHERLDAGAEADLTVQLTLPGDDTRARDLFTVVFDPGVEDIALEAEISAPGFKVIGPRTKPLRLLRQRNADQEKAVFRLKAKDPPDAAVLSRIIVTFLREGEQVGSVTHDTTITRPGYEGPLPNGIDIVRPVRVSPLPRQTSDLVIMLRRPDPARDHFEISMRAQYAGSAYESRDMGEFNLDGKDLPAWISSYVDEAFLKFPPDELSDAQFEAALPNWNETFRQTLVDMGKALWGHLPLAFREEYLRLAGLAEPPRSIAIASDELTFPWELVRPSGKVSGTFVQLPPMGMAHVIGRWKPAVDTRPQPQRLKVTSVALVMPDAASSGLAWTTQEIAKLKARLPGAELLQPATRAGLENLLDNGQVQLMHFSGHGVPGQQPDLDAFELEGGTQIPAPSFAQSALAANHHPILVLNACSLGRSRTVMKRAGGFASACIDNGWSGIIAPYWPIYDAKASEFSEKLYGKLASGAAVGEALNELRIENPDDPTYLSYSWFGDPFAAVMFA
ncbi:MAG TPA: CHAT domain-containing protein [Aquabacterium sp.]|nr:CHAT domain-containing protein [Aquabacterium sp.]